MLRAMRALGRVADAPRTFVVPVALALVRPRAAGRLADERLGVLRNLAVGEHEEPERLTVRPARRPGRGEQHRPQRAGRHRLVAIAADRARRREPFEQPDGVFGQRFGSKFVDDHGPMIARDCERHAT
jgi:hypothetical protein